MKVELRKLANFVAVAEAGSFTKAAAKLHIVQSGLSMSVRSLEREIGATLFERTTQHVQLTEAGAVLLPRARLLLAAERDARQAVTEVRDGLRGTLELGVLFTLTLTPARLPPLLARFRQTHPGVEIRLRTPLASGTADHVQSLRHGRLALAFLMSNGPLPGIHQHRLASERLVLACAADHWLADRESVALAELLDEDFIDFPPGWGVRAALDRVFIAAGLPERRTTCEMNDLSTMLDLVRHRLGVAFVPKSIADQADDLRILTVQGQQPGYDLVIGVAAGRPLGPITGAFLNLVLAELVTS